MNKFKLNSTQIIIGSFLLVILVSSLLLMLPIASKMGVWTNFLDCVFTATSSLCVTGLVVFDTATYWSIFGQIIILILIQMGGLGIIMVTSIIIIILGQKVSLFQRTTLQQALSVQKVGGIVKLTKFIIKGTIFFELLGSLILFLHFKNEFPMLKAIWLSIFHSISAFCNAGFDLMGFTGKFSSLSSLKSNILVNTTIMFLIVIGGLGFIVWDDIVKKKFNFHQYKLQSKLVLFTTFFLILIPTLFFYFYEFKNYPSDSRFLVSIFQSITTRTAGFNTINPDSLSEASKGITIALMLIGGSPGSTAGGMKTTTFIVMLISTFAIFRKENEATIFNRRIRIEIIRNAIAIFMMYINLFLISGLILCIIEDISLIEALYETSSAIGTVGSSLGVTTKLSNISKVIIIFLMFMGRVGGLTFIYAIMPSLNKKSGYIYEDVTVG